MTGGAGRIEIRGVSLHYEAARGALEAVRHVDLDICPGEIRCLLGPSGCGKSTLLAAIAGHITPTRGVVCLDGNRIEGPSADRGVVSQRKSLLPWRTVIENVAFGPKMRGVPARTRRDEAHELLALVGLTSFASHYPAELSGGMQQRVEIARVLANRPRVMLMDEPFAALDAQTRLMMQELLLAIRARIPTTIVFVTHDIEEAIFLGDRVSIMSSRPGRILEDLVVPFARPRDPEITTDPAFVTLKRTCLHRIREESLRGMGPLAIRESTTP